MARKDRRLSGSCRFRNSGLGDHICCVVGEEFVDLAGDFIMNRPHRYTKDTLSPLEEIDNFFGARCRVDR